MEQPPALTAESVNSDEIETQGLWGNRSSKEVGVVIAAIVAGVAVLASVFLLVDSNNDRADGRISNGRQFQRPLEPSLTVATVQEELDVLRTAFDRFTATEVYLESVPVTPDLLEGLHEEDAAAPEVRAAAWLLHVDPLNEHHQIVRRFALASMYYSLNGTSWFRSEGWLTDTSHCEWEGVLCCGEAVFSPSAFLMPVHEVCGLELRSNNLAGELPEAVVFFQGLADVGWSFNKINGKINEAIFNQLPLLQTIYLQHNRLTGTIPAGLKSENNGLDHLFLHGNLLTGVYPAEFCEPCETCEGGFQGGIDCDLVVCNVSVQCCSNQVACFVAPTLDDLDLSP